MALYQDYETTILTENGIDIRDAGTKRDIELYDLDQMLQLPAEPLERIRNFVDDYSSLTGQIFKPRYYQVLALLFTECFFADQQQLDRLDTNSEEKNNGCWRIGWQQVVGKPISCILISFNICTTSVKRTMPVYKFF